MGSCTSTPWSLAVARWCPRFLPLPQQLCLGARLADQRLRRSRHLRVQGAQRQRCPAAGLRGRSRGCARVRRPLAALPGCIPRQFLPCRGNTPARRPCRVRGLRLVALAPWGRSDDQAAPRTGIPEGPSTGHLAGASRSARAGRGRRSLPPTHMGGPGRSAERTSPRGPRGAAPERRVLSARPHGAHRWGGIPPRRALRLRPGRRRRRAPGGPRSGSDPRWSGRPSASYRGRADEDGAAHRSV